jgi:hypothetical protein
MNWLRFVDAVQKSASKIYEEKLAEQILEEHCFFSAEVKNCRATDTPSSVYRNRHGLQEHGVVTVGLSVSCF